MIQNNLTQPVSLLFGRTARLTSYATHTLDSSLLVLAGEWTLMPKLEKEQVKELIQEDIAGDIFVGKLEECAKEQKEIDEYQEFHDDWVKKHEGTKINKHLSMLREDVIAAMQFDLDKEKSKWKRLLEDNMGVKPKFTNDEFDLELIKEVPIQDLFTMEKERETTQRIGCLCPLHTEKTPSFTIYKDTNSFCCFGCGEAGDNIAFMMLLHQVKFKDACMMIAHV